MFSLMNFTEPSAETEQDPARMIAGGRAMRLWIAFGGCPVDLPLAVQHEGIRSADSAVAWSVAPKIRPRLRLLPSICHLASATMN